MRPYTKVFLSLAACLLLISIGVWWMVIRSLTVIPNKPEPRYQDHTLSEWLHIYGESSHFDEGKITHSNKAERAIQAIGTNALPLILEWLSEDPTDARLLLANNVQAFLMSETQRSLASKKIEEQMRRSGRAIFYFQVMGRDAINAIPALTQLIHGRPEIHRRAVYALAMTGSNSLPVMATLLAATNPAVRCIAVRSICAAQREGIDWSTAVPLLLDHAKDTDLSVSLNAIATLGITRQQPESCIPLFTNFLNSTNESVRAVTLIALGRFGSTAKQAIPAVLPLLQDSEEFVRGDATNALHKIAPEIYTNVWTPPPGPGPGMPAPMRK